MSENYKMTLKEAVKLCHDHNIYQLNKGESLKDALDFIHGKIPRKGYRVRANNRLGRKLTENEIIAHENKIAFTKGVKPVEYREDFVEDIEDATEDYRQDKTKRGIMANCFYCGVVIRVDGECEDYPKNEPETHCDDCMDNAILNLCM